MCAHIERRPAQGARLALVSGLSGSGKTTICRELAAAGSRRGLAVSGLLTEVERAPGGATRWVRDLRSARRRLLAREAEGARAGDLRWRLMSDGLRWGDRVLAAACPTDVLIIDEIGPLELVDGSGWYGGMLHALGGPFRLAVVAVRPSLVSPLLELVTPLVGTAVLVTSAGEPRAVALIEDVLAEVFS